MGLWGQIHDGFLVAVHQFEGNMREKNPAQNWVDLTNVDGGMPIGTLVNGHGNAVPTMPGQIVNPQQVQAAIVGGRAHLAESEAVYFKPSGSDKPLPFSTDQASLTTLLVFDHANIDEAPIAAADGTRVALSSGEVAELLAKIGQYVADCRKAGHAMADKVAAGEQVDYEAGWPDNGAPKQGDAPASAPPAPAPVAGTADPGSDHVGVAEPATDSGAPNYITTNSAAPADMAATEQGEAATEEKQGD